MSTIRELLEKINTEKGFTGIIRYNEPMAAHTTLRVGGPADAWVRPEGDGFPGYAAALLREARARGVPVFILGGGANLVAADRGIRGIVLDTSGWTGCAAEPGVPDLWVRSGTPVEALTAAAAEQGLGGLEFLAGMPGSAGGAVWMNARCYGSSVSDVLAEAEFLDESLEFRSAPMRAEDFSYKRSPFQTRRDLILSVRFRLRERPPAEILREMEGYRRDREEKGHYRFPSAGSAFKNNQDFGKPTGKIIDELGLRGLRIGGAAVADYHGNIIINTGGARAADIRALVETLREKVRSSLGILLEPEILFVGDWPPPPPPEGVLLKR
ncbi:MAG: UDP-N-acetylmuramate dehydrogenase [Spirochaetaceae bacterium]|nr:UDP-N-acetylmuramate dehydrogenase [Spirochaetaceae bacterium]